MSFRKKAFPGRLIFDHLPKTAGQAINAWMVEELGAGCVTTNLIGDHSDLIRQYGGLYSVISAHVGFKDGEGLDPRYQYMTLFRDPVDRVVSWLFFVINNHDDVQLPGLRQAAIQFLQEEENSLAGYVENAYVKHFCGIEGNGAESDDQKIANALAVIKKYDVVGLYDDMPQFLAEAAALIGVREPKKLGKVNVTTQRPLVDEITPALRERIIALNSLDIRLFEEVVAWKKSLPQKSSSTSVPPITESLWTKREPLPDRELTTTDVVVAAPSLREGFSIAHGQLVTLEMDIFLAREMHDLEMGIHIFDVHRRLVFGINNTLLGQSHRAVSGGAYQVSHHILANLPAGRYTAGFAFAERLPEGVKELFWRDAMCEFEVSRPAGKIFAGNVCLPAGISFRPAFGAAARTLAEIVVTQHAGCLLAPQSLPPLTAGEVTSIDIEVRNHSDQAWVGDDFRPISLSYHWLNTSGEEVLFDGLRTAIPAGGIAAHASRHASMQVQAPLEAGAYILVLTLVQEGIAWFESKGFEMGQLSIEVVHA